MARGFTYSFVDRLGKTHSRYSAGHLTPLYTHGVITYRGNKEQPVSPGKHGVQYSSRLDLANAAAARCDKVFVKLGVITDVVELEVAAGKVDMIPKPAKESLDE